MGFYPSDNYQALAEFGGSRIAPITLTEHRVRTLAEALPALCDAMQRGELYTRKDCAFRLRSCKTNNCARLYRDNKVCQFYAYESALYDDHATYSGGSTKPVYPRAGGRHVVRLRRAKFTVFAEPPRSNASQIPYDQLFEELKLRLI